MNGKYNILDVIEDKIPTLGAARVSPELIPHSEFHTGTWLHSPEKNGWYYFMKKANRNTIQNPFFLRTLDPPLRNLVAFLHRKNIRTTPSCAGHHINEKQLERIFESLERDKEKILAKGLNLTDVESGKIYFYRDANYYLPWTKNDFISKLERYQQKGVLGIRLGKMTDVKNEILKIQITGVDINERDGITFIFTDESRSGDNSSAWKEITKQVKQILR